MPSPSKDHRDYYDPDRDRRFTFETVAAHYREITALDWGLRALWLVLFAIAVLEHQDWAFFASLVVLLVSVGLDVRYWRRGRRSGWEG